MTWREVFHVEHSLWWQGRIVPRGTIRFSDFPWRAAQNVAALRSRNQVRTPPRPRRLGRDLLRVFLAKPQNQMSPVAQLDPRPCTQLVKLPERASGDKIEFLDTRAERFHPAREYRRIPDPKFTQNLRQECAFLQI